MKKSILIVTLFVLIALIEKNAKIYSEPSVPPGPAKLQEVETLPKLTSPNAPIEVTSTPQKSQKVTVHDRVGLVRELSSHVLLTAKQRSDLEDQLRNPELQSHVRHLLISGNWLTEKDLSVRAAALDVIYEGLKAKDQGLSAQYFDVAEQIIAAEPPVEIVDNREAMDQFSGDRVELALVAQQLSGDQYQRLKARTQSVNPNTRSIFSKTDTLKNIYKVSL